MKAPSENFSLVEDLVLGGGRWHAHQSFPLILQCIWYMYIMCSLVLWTMIDAGCCDCFWASVFWRPLWSRRNEWRPDGQLHPDYKSPGVFFSESKLLPVPERSCETTCRWQPLSKYASYMYIYIYIIVQICMQNNMYYACMCMYNPAKNFCWKKFRPGQLQCTYIHVHVYVLLKYSNYAHAVKGHHSLLLGSVYNNALTQNIKLVTSFSPCFIFQV